MPKYVMVQPDDSGIFLTPEFPDEPTAQAFATANGIGGTIMEEAAFFLTPYSEDLQEEQAREATQEELEAEGNRRSLLVDPHYESVLNGFVVGLSVNATTALGGQWVAVGVAWDDARLVVEALPNLAAILAYDVVTDPAWP